MSGRGPIGVRKVSGLCVVSGRCLEGIRRVSGMRMEDVCRFDRGCLEGVWNKNHHLISNRRKGPIYVWKVPASCTESFWKVCGKCPEGAWYVSRKCYEGVWIVEGVWTVFGGSLGGV